MARPTKLTPEVQKQIVDAIAIGAAYTHAVGAAGVAYQTFLNWMETGEKVASGELKKTKARKTYLEFFERVERAKSEAFVKYTKTIASAAAAGDWRAAESFLKRRDPENWGDKQNIASETSGTMEIVVKYANADG